MPQSHAASPCHWLARLHLLLPVVVLLLAPLVPSATAAQLPFFQQSHRSHRSQHQQHIIATPQQHRVSHTSHRQIPDDDLAIVPSVRLSHHGLYINDAHTLAGHPAPSLEAFGKHAQPAFSPLSLTLYIDTHVYRAESIVVHLNPVRRRTRDQVMLECGTHYGGIESCERDDLHAARTGHDQATNAAGTLECRFHHPGAVKAGGRIVLDSHACPGWHQHWSQTYIRLEANKHDHDHDHDHDDESLDSYVVSLSVPANNSRHPSSRSVERLWWVGQLRLFDSRASWPLAGNARSRRLGTDDREWREDDSNRISGSMENPFIPKTSKDEPADPQQGVYVEQSSWNLGVQIRIPPALTIPSPSSHNDTSSTSSELDVSSSSSSSMLLPPPEEVFAPVAGQVVWSRPYLRRRPPLVGDGAGWNDESDHCLMIRDEWSIVYQIFGIDPSTLSLSEGDEVARGDVLGHALREGLSSMPPSTEPPADHSETKDDRSVRYYPYRYRKLEVRVARPHRDWTEWKDPDELGWQYFQPLQVFRDGRTRDGKRYRSNVPPYGSPTTLYFARPSTDPLNVPSVAFASSDDFFVPTLTGQIEMYAGFEAFQATPGDPADGMEPLALYAMDLGVRKKRDGERPPDKEKPCDLGGDEDQTYKWRNMWEHSKIPSAWTSPFDQPAAPASVRWRSKLFSHYLASFSYGTWFPTKFTSQFDEKSKRLFYVVGRQVRGEPKVSGSLDVAELMDEGRGRYRIAVRGRDYWGNVGCVASDVNLG